MDMKFDGGIQKCDAGGGLGFAIHKYNLYLYLFNFYFYVGWFHDCEDPCCCTNCHEDEK